MSLPTPYYERNGITIYCGDALEILPQLPAGCADKVLTDPPYNAPDIGTEHRVYEGNSQPMSPDTYREWCKEWFAKAWACCPNLLFTPGISNLWHYPQARWVLAWSKPGARSFNGTGGFNIWEPILYYGKCGKFLEDVIRQVPINLTNGVEHKHPCPKPKPVWDWLIKYGTRHGETILDPFLGAGTTAVCAKKQGRNCIGIERVPEYCEIAVRRLSQEVMDFHTLPNLEKELKSE